MSGDPNENTRGQPRETVAFDRDYKTSCCNAVRHFNKGDTFEFCTDHGDTTWLWIPPIAPVSNTDFGMASLIEHWKQRQPKTHHVVATSTIAFESRFTGEVKTPKPVLPELLLQATIAVFGEQTNEG